MTTPVPTLVSWSGGKDCAMALLELQRSAEYDIIGLVTTIDSEDDRIAFHNVRGELVRAQAEALGLPLHEIALPPSAGNLRYEAAMRDAIAHLAPGKDAAIAYGDLFLEDIRAYREGLAARIGVRPIFPVWKRDTRKFIDNLVATGFDAVVVSVDLAHLDASFAGRRLDSAFMADLPSNVDPCGENGEFHSFVLDGPNFAFPVKVTPGVRSERDGYGYCELVLAESSQKPRLGNGDRHAVRRQEC